MVHKFQVAGVAFASYAASCASITWHNTKHSWQIWLQRFCVLCHLFFYGGRCNKTLAAASGQPTRRITLRCRVFLFIGTNGALSLVGVISDIVTWPKWGFFYGIRRRLGDPGPIQAALGIACVGCQIKHGRMPSFPCFKSRGALSFFAVAMTVNHMLLPFLSVCCVRAVPESSLLLSDAFGSFPCTRQSKWDACTAAELNRNSRVRRSHFLR